MRVRVILQTGTLKLRGILFDDDGVREISEPDIYKLAADGKPCCLLVSADFPRTRPFPGLGFCTTIVVTSQNLNTEPDLKSWWKRSSADRFVAPPPSCPEVVYLLSKVWHYDSYFVYWMYREWARDFRSCRINCEDAIRHLKDGTLFEWYEMKTQSIKSYARWMLGGFSDPDGMRDSESNMMIQTDLVTMERRDHDNYNVVLMTPRIADIVIDVQRAREWYYNCEALEMCFRNPETREAARNIFHSMFLEKFQTDLSKMPRCFEMDDLEMDDLEKRATMPWEGLGAQPTLEYTSIGKDAGSYSKELGAVIDAVMDKDSPPIRLAKNWASWDAAAVLYVEEEGRRAVHIILLETTIRRDRLMEGHEIYAKGLNQVRDAIPAKWKHGDELDIHYHYVLVLLVSDNAYWYIPKRRRVLLSSKERKEDPSWSPDDLRQYVMFVPMKVLFKPLIQG